MDIDKPSLELNEPIQHQPNSNPLDRAISLYHEPIKAISGHGRTIMTEQQRVYQEGRY